MIEIYQAHCTPGEQPRFSWKLRGTTGQSGYQIRVSDRTGALIWDSQRQTGSERHNINCGFQPPKGGFFRWNITCYGEDGSAAVTEGNSFFSEIPEWTAQWIEPDRVRKPLQDDLMPHSDMSAQSDPLERLDPAVYLRKEFELESRPEQAVAYVSAHGIYALWVNGMLVSDLYAPGFTSYHRRVDYQSYDVTTYLKTGKNIIGVILADGWYTGRIGAVGIGQQYGSENALLLQIEGQYQNGAKTLVSSDSSFSWNTGAIRYADLFVGEYYDENLKLKNWLRSECPEGGWKSVLEKKYGYAALSQQSIASVKTIKVISPKVFYSPKGELILDAGETIVGFAAFSLELKKGDKIRLEYSETLDREGNFLYYMSCQNKHQTDLYESARDGLHSWQPQFSFHGFRYVRLTGTQNANPVSYLIHVVGTDLKRAGNFSCSDERLNQLQENIFRSQQGNMISIPTDCPQREKTGWTGDAQVYAATACYEMDMEDFLRHWLVDMAHEQLPDGQIPHIIPYIPSHDKMKPPGIEGVSAAGWSDAAVILPWRLYEAYGDAAILRENFEMMRRYMKSTEQRAAAMPQGSGQMTPEQKERQRFLWNTDFQYGDWLMPGVPALEGAIHTGSEVATMMYAITTEMMTKICRILGKQEESCHYQELNQKIKMAIQAEYMNPDGTMKKSYQGVYVLALAADVVPYELRKNTVAELARLIRENGNRLGTGFLSVPYLLPVLDENHQKELAHDLLFQDQCPSWLYEVKMGATTMWESWDAYDMDGTPKDYSMNHFAFGCVGEYLFRSILGIRSIRPGFSELSIQPDLQCGLSSAEGYYDSIWGRIAVRWEKDSLGNRMEITLPPDVTARVMFEGNEQDISCGTWKFSSGQTGCLVRRGNEYE